MRRWQSRNGLQATYGNLLESFIEAGHTKCAEVICEVLRKKCELGNNIMAIALPIHYVGGVFTNTGFYPLG